jgi:hypothetical protein
MSVRSYTIDTNPEYGVGGLSPPGPNPATRPEAPGRSVYDEV